MIRKKFWISFIFILAAGVIWGNRPLTTVYGEVLNQTIPTRTPTPQPTATATTGGGNDDGGGATATNTPGSQTGATATATQSPADIAPTPLGGFLPTAVPCGSQPTIQTLGATNVRSGPGVDYPIVGQLVYLEVRYIVGRAETAEWWLIEINNGQTGWVADEIVLVQGYTPIIPIVEAPEINGETPTPGPQWQPTPLPLCTVTPTPTYTPTLEPTTEPTVAEATATNPATATAVPPTEVQPTNTPIVQPTAVSPDPTPTAAVASAPQDPPTSDGRIGLILLGIGAVIGVGLVIFFIRRRS